MASTLGIIASFTLFLSYLVRTFQNPSQAFSSFCVQLSPTITHWSLDLAYVTELTHIKKLKTLSTNDINDISTRSCNRHGDSVSSDPEQSLRMWGAATDHRRHIYEAAFLSLFVGIRRVGNLMQDGVEVLTKQAVDIHIQDWPWEKGVGNVGDPSLEANQVQSPVSMSRRTMMSF